MNGRKIAEARRARGLSQAELGRIMGVSQQAISKYESSKGDIDGETLKRLSSVLGVTISYLLGMDAEACASGSDAMSTDERVLVECFRECTPRYREMLLMTARSFRDSSKESAVGSKSYGKAVNE